VIEVDIQGIDVLVENFDSLSIGVRDRVLKKAINAAAKPIMATAKQYCPTDLGTLKDSISLKVSAKGTKGNAVTAVIGPKRGIKVPIRVAKRGAHKGQTLMAVPTRYAHFVEFGHLDKSGDRVPPEPFMRPAWDEDGGEVALNRFADAATLGVVDEVAKLPKGAPKP